MRVDIRRRAGRQHTARPTGDCAANRGWKMLGAVRNRGWRFLLGVLAAVAATQVACAQHDVAVEYYGGRIFSSSEQRSIQRIADRAAIDVRRALPGLPGRLILRVRTG